MSNLDGHDDIPEITLGWRLRIAMENAGIKADDMAVELGVHRGTITRWTHDIGSPPRVIYVQRWAELCRVSFDWLAGGEYEEVRARSLAGASSSSGVSSRSNREWMSPERGYAFEGNLACDLAGAAA